MAENKALQLAKETFEHRCSSCGARGRHNFKNKNDDHCIDCDEYMDAVVDDVNEEFPDG